MENNQPSNPITRTDSFNRSEELYNISSTLSSIMSEVYEQVDNNDSDSVENIDESESDSIESTSLELTNIDKSDVESSLSVDKDSDNENDLSRLGVTILQVKYQGDKLYNDYYDNIKWCQISKKLNLDIPNMKISSIINYMSKCKDTKAILSKSIPLIIYKGNLVKEDLNITEFDTSLLIILKEVNFNRYSRNFTFGSQNIQNILSSYGFEFPSSNIPSNMISNMFMEMMNDTSFTNVNAPAQNSDDEDQDSDDEETNNTEDVQINNNQTLNALNQLISMYSSNSVSQTSIQNNLREQYKDEIETMKAMGLSDENKILQSLSVCEGNVEHAVNYYFSID